MNDAAAPAGARAAATLLEQADGAALRLGSVPATGTGRVTIVVAAFCAVGLTVILSDVPPRAGLLLTVALMLVLIALTITGRRARSILPRGWDRRLAASPLLLYLAVFLVNTGALLSGDRPRLPLGISAVIAVVVAAPLAASGLWLVRRRPRPARPQAVEASNPFVVLAALASVDGVGLRALRDAAGFPVDDLDRILSDFDRRELVDLGWGGSRPGLNTPVSLTATGRAAYTDVRERLVEAAERDVP